tara:strand:- start:1750 stop:2001 length:252 start_codon:yes stop_codon:yes gene_type:complete
MTDYWVSIQRDRNRSETALFSNFRKKAGDLGINTLTHEPTDNRINAKVSFDGSVDELAQKVASITGDTATVSTKRDTVFLTPI